MSDLSSLLAPIRERVAEALPCDGQCGTLACEAESDRSRLLAAIDAVLALVDESDIHDQDYGERLAIGYLSTDSIRTAVTAALGEQA